MGCQENELKYARVLTQYASVLIKCFRTVNAVQLFNYASLIIKKANLIINYASLFINHYASIRSEPTMVGGAQQAQTL